MFWGLGFRKAQASDVALEMLYYLKSVKFVGQYDQEKMPKTMVLLLFSQLIRAVE